MIPSNSHNALSPPEICQLGQPKQLRANKRSRYTVIPASHWPRVRELLLTRSRTRCPDLNPELTAYTPGETLSLLEHPIIRDWHARARGFVLPPYRGLARGGSYAAVAFVPCSSAKPWGTLTSGSYGGYNRIRQDVREGRLPPVYLVTISEPLGIVPECWWDAFPLYDNPGLFRSDYLRSGLKDRAWATLVASWGDLPAGKYVLPFDEEAYQRVISHLAEVLGAFVSVNRRLNQALRFISFVSNRAGEEESHEAILRAANNRVSFLAACDIHSKGKKGASNRYEHLRTVLASLDNPR